jgi:hypothetical protein
VNASKLDPIALAGVDYRSKGDLRRGWIADWQLVGLGRELADIGAVQTAMHEMPARRHADLALVQKRSHPCRNSCDNSRVASADQTGTPAFFSDVAQIRDLWVQYRVDG